MHAKLDAAAETLTDSMRMFRLGLEGGKPAPGQVGVQPEWFYKGDGDWLVAPGEPLVRPSFALDGGDGDTRSFQPTMCYDFMPAFNTARTNGVSCSTEVGIIHHLFALLDVEKRTVDVSSLFICFRFLL